MMMMTMKILSCQIKSDIFLASQLLHLKHHREDKNQDKRQRHTQLTQHSQKTIFKAVQRTFDQGLCSVYNFRTDWCTEECFSLSLLNHRTLYVQFGINNLYSLFKT